MTMKHPIRNLMAAVTLIAASLFVRAQTNTPPKSVLSATVTAPNGNPLANAVYRVQMIDSMGQSIPGTTSVKYQGQPFTQTSFNGTLDASGYFSVSLAQTSAFVVSNNKPIQYQISISAPTASDNILFNQGQAWNIVYATAVTADTDASAALSAMAKPVNFVNLNTGQSTLTTTAGCTGANSLAKGCTGATDQPGAFSNIVGPGGTMTGPLTAPSVTADYNSAGAVRNLGDSLTFGTAAAGNFGWAQQLDSAFGAADINNTAIGGSWTCDVNHYQAFGVDNPAASQAPLVTWLSGANDQSHAGIGPYEVNTKACAYAGAAWETQPSTNKVFARNATSAGTWINDDTYQSAFALQSTTNGSTLTFSLTTQGHGSGLYYRVIDGNGGTFSVTVDGTLFASVNAFPVTPINTVASGNGSGGTTMAVWYLSIPGLSAGTHSIVATVTSATGAGNIVSILGVGTFPTLSSLSFQPPKLFMFGLPYRSADASAASTAAYNADMLAVASQLIADGSHTTSFDVRACIGSSSTYYEAGAGTIHWNTFGHTIVLGCLANLMHPFPGGGSTGINSATFTTETADTVLSGPEQVVGVASTVPIARTITNFSVTSNVVTLTFTPTTSILTPIAGSWGTFAGLSTATWLNGQTLQVLSTGLTTTQFQVAFTHADVGATADSGTFAVPMTVMLPPNSGQTMQYGKIVTIMNTGTGPATILPNTGQAFTQNVGTTAFKSSICPNQTVSFILSLHTSTTSYWFPYATNNNGVGDTFLYPCGTATSAANYNSPQLRFRAGFIDGSALSETLEWQMSHALNTSGVPNFDQLTIQPPNFSFYGITMKPILMLAPPTKATVGNNINSAWYGQQASYDSGSGVAASDTWRLGAELGAGVNPTTDWRVFHSGTSGAASFDFRTYSIPIKVYQTIWKDPGSSHTMTVTGPSLAADITVAAPVPSGSTNTYCSTSGTLTSGHIVKFDASGNCIDGGAAPSGGVPLFFGVGSTGTSLATTADAMKITRYPITPGFTFGHVVVKVGTTTDAVNNSSFGVYNADGSNVCTTTATTGGTTSNQFTFACSEGAGRVITSNSFLFGTASHSGTQTYFQMATTPSTLCVGSGTAPSGSTGQAPSSTSVPSDIVAVGCATATAFMLIP